MTSETEVKHNCNIRFSELHGSSPPQLQLLRLPGSIISTISLISLTSLDRKTELDGSAKVKIKNVCTAALEKLEAQAKCFGNGQDLGLIDIVVIKFRILKHGDQKGEQFVHK